MVLSEARSRGNCRRCVLIFRKSVSRKPPSSSTHRMPSGFSNRTGIRRVNENDIVPRRRTREPIKAGTMWTILEAGQESLDQLLGTHTRGAGSAGQQSRRALGGRSGLVQHTQSFPSTLAPIPITHTTILTLPSTSRDPRSWSRLTPSETGPGCRPEESLPFRIGRRRRGVGPCLSLYTYGAASCFVRQDKNVLVTRRCFRIAACPRPGVDRLLDPQALARQQLLYKSFPIAHRGLRLGQIQQRIITELVLQGMGASATSLEQPLLHHLARRK